MQVLITKKKKGSVVQDKNIKLCIILSTETFLMTKSEFTLSYAPSHTMALYGAVSI
jgi:hypothetical protein